MSKATACRAVRGMSLGELRSHPLVCEAGYAIVGWRLSSEGCAKKRHMHFLYDCVQIGETRPPHEMVSHVETSSQVAGDSKEGISPLVASSNCTNAAQVSCCGLDHP